MVESLGHLLFLTKGLIYTKPGMLPSQGLSSKHDGAQAGSKQYFLGVLRKAPVQVPAPRTSGDPGLGQSILEGAQSLPSSPFLPSQQPVLCQLSTLREASNRGRRGKQVLGCQSRTRLEQERTGLNRR